MSMDTFTMDARTTDGIAKAVTVTLDYGGDA